MARKRLRPVRLTDVPLAIRCQAAIRLAAQYDDANIRASLLAAAIRPSNERYWVPAE